MHSYLPQNVLSILVSLSLSACGGGGGDGESDSPSTSGQSTKEAWVGLYRATSGPEVNEPGIVLPDVYEGGILIDMRKQNSNVTGSYETTDGGEGTVSGSFTPEGVNLTLTPNESCPGEIHVQGTPSEDGAQVTTSISGSDCTRIYHTGAARLLKVPPSPVGTDFTGVYYGTNLNRTGFLLSVETQNSHDFRGRVWVLSTELGSNDDDSIDMLSSPVSGTLGNADDQCSSYCYSRLEMTDIDSDIIDANGDSSGPHSGHVMILDYYSVGSKTELQTRWSFETEQGNTGTGSVYMSTPYE